MRKVWAASSGSYSDYGVDVLFSTEAAAQAYCDAHGTTGSQGHFVEGFTLYEESDPQGPVGEFFSKKLEINRASGEIHAVPGYSYKTWLHNQAPERPKIDEWDWQQPAHHVIQGQCRDERALDKALTDRAVQYVAELGLAAAPPSPEPEGQNE